MYLPPELWIIIDKFELKLRIMEYKRKLENILKFPLKCTQTFDYDEYYIIICDSKFKYIWRIYNHFTLIQFKIYNNISVNTLNFTYGN